MATGHTPLSGEFLQGDPSAPRDHSTHLLHSRKVGLLLSNADCASPFPSSTPGQQSPSPSMPGAKEQVSVRLDCSLSSKLACGRQTLTTLDSLVPSGTFCHHQGSRAEGGGSQGALPLPTLLHLTLLTCPLLFLFQDTG